MTYLRSIIPDPQRAGYIVTDKGAQEVHKHNVTFEWVGTGVPVAVLIYLGNNQYARFLLNEGEIIEVK